MQCISRPHGSSANCKEHTEASTNTPQPTEPMSDEEGVSSRTRSKTRGKPESVTTVAEESGCTKTFVCYKGHTSGLLIAARPCNTIVDIHELVMPESTHDILQRVTDLMNDGVNIGHLGYDNACHVHQSAKKYNMKDMLEKVTFFIDRYACNT